MEESTGHYHCIQLMWHIQDDILTKLKILLQYLNEKKEWDKKSFNSVFGEMYLKMGALIYREEKILYPVAYSSIGENRFRKMIHDLPEYGTSFGIKVQNTQGDKMSENLQNSENRKNELREIIGNLKNDQDIKKMKKRFSAILKDLSPEEIAEAEQALITEGVPVEEVQKLCEVHVAAFEDALTKFAAR